MRFHRALGLALMLAAAAAVSAGAVTLALAGGAARPAPLLAALLAGAAAGFAAAGVLGARLATALRQPLREIAAAAWAGAEGRLRPVRTHTFAELAEPIEGFNAMVAWADRTIAELDRQRRTLESVLTHMSEALLILDPEGAIVLANPSAERTFGFAAPLAAGHRLIEIIHHFELDALVRQAVRERTPLVRELEVHHPERRLLRVQAMPVRDRRGTFLGIVLVAQDVTDLHRTDLVRREFVANVSHELRTPLTSLRAVAETLLEGALRDPEAAPRFLHRIVDEIDRLTLLVNDLLDLSAIETGSATLEMAAVPPAEIIRDVLAKFRPVAERRGVRLAAEPADGLPAVWGDEARLVQALANLVDNAVKYTPDRGTVTVSVRDVGDLVAFSVADTGVGIAPEHLPRIFERFYRIDRSRSRALGGTGLGLSIVKHIATSHGGRVEVESTEGRGSRFTLLVPKASATPARR